MIHLHACLEKLNIISACIAYNFVQQCTPSAQLASSGMQWSGINKMTESKNIIIPSLIMHLFLLHIVEYNTSWICEEEDAFVHCGMNFTYNDQKLHVPICGIYEIYSQIFFRHESAVFHNVEVNRGCSHSTDNTAEFKSYAGLFPNLNPSTATWATTTNLVATVKMCAGGTVSVVIPQDSACCAWGKKSSTYFSARLISEVNCNSI